MKAWTHDRQVRVLRELLILSVLVGASTSLVLLIAPSFVARLLFGSEAGVEAEALGQVCALALASLCLASWPRPGSEHDLARAARGMIAYNLLVGLYFAFVAIRGAPVGIVLLPACLFHIAIGAAQAVLQVRAGPALHGIRERRVHS
ncbi:MAG: hypothetical protein JST54_13130 [Deltaproteobacteria bacterium]|nr:hypothetical protein [Deltaproteobacteria bacterium]